MTASPLADLRAADAALAAASGAGLHLPPAGLEAVILGAIGGLSRGEWWIPGPRERVGGALRGAPVERLIDPVAGARPYKIGPTIAAPALRALVAVGLALGSGKRALAHLGVGALADGAFTEALNLGALHRAPVVLLVAVHPLDGDAPLGPQSAASPEALGAAYGWRVLTVDGADADAVEAAVRTADADGPTLIVAALPGRA